MGGWIWLGLAAAAGEPCPARQHDGGDGVCTPTAACSAGFTREETGFCSQVVPGPALGLGRRDAGASVSFDGRTWMIGGEAGEEVRTEVLAQDGSAWATAPMAVEPRRHHTLTRLADGRLLVLGGGVSGPDQPRLGFVFDPATEQWSTTGPLDRARAGHAASLLADGTVLVTGGTAGLDLLASSVVYDPASNGFRDGPPMARSRAHHVQIVLPDGRVVVIGGLGPDGQPIADVEVFEPRSARWVTASPLAEPRAFAAAAVLDERGRVLVTGGLGPGRVHRTTEIWTPARDAWATGPSMRDPRWDHTLDGLTGGRWVVVGGARTPAGRAQDGIEVMFDGRWVPVGSLAEARFGHTSVLLPGGLLVCGGVGSGVALDSVVVSSTCEWYRSGAE